MEQLYFYLTGILTGTLLVFSFYYKIKYKKVISENKILSQKVLAKKKYDKKGCLLWKGWHLKSDKTNIWSITLYMNVIAISHSNPNLYQFEIESFYSQNPSDPWGKKEYEEYFKKETNGGWFNISNMSTKYDFNWITNQSKEEIRDSKLDKLGF